MKTFFACVLCLVIGLIAFAKDNDHPSRLVLKSPNGKNTITIQATDSIAGIWITAEDNTQQVAIWNDKHAAALGIYQKIDGTKGIDIGLSSTAKGGFIQMTKRGEVFQFDADDFKK